MNSVTIDKMENEVSKIDKTASNDPPNAVVREDANLPGSPAKVTSLDNQQDAPDYDARASTRSYVPRSQTAAEMRKSQLRALVSLS